MEKTYIYLNQGQYSMMIVRKFSGNVGSPAKKG